jgi:hypothetical protein
MTGIFGTSEVVKSATASALLCVALMLVEYKSESLAETIGCQDSTLSIDIVS